MKRKIIIVGIFVFLCIIILSTICILLNLPQGEQKNDTLDNHFIGSWQAMEESSESAEQGTLYYEYSFHGNHSAHLEIFFNNETTTQQVGTIWREYSFNGTHLSFQLPQGEKFSYTYHFNQMYDTLVLSQSNVSLSFEKMN